MKIAVGYRQPGGFEAAEIAEWLEAFDEVVVAEWAGAGSRASPRRCAIALAARASPHPRRTSDALHQCHPKATRNSPTPATSTSKRRHPEPHPLERRWPWCRTARTSTMPASAATSRHIPRWRRCSARWASTTSSTRRIPDRATATSPEIHLLSGAMPRPASMPFALSLKAASTKPHLEQFRRQELRDTPGCAYLSPHPWLMPGLLELPDRLDGPRPVECNLPGTLHALILKAGS